MASIEFGTGDPLDAGSALVERLNAAFLRRWEVGFEKFERARSLGRQAIETVPRCDSD
jgi:hypothetical protein